MVMSVKPMMANAYNSAILSRHPTYSINGILGIPQSDANANLQKRKRDEEGKLSKLIFSVSAIHILCQESFAAKPWVRRFMYGD